MYIDLSHMKSGFCDRLRQITFCIAYNRLKKKNIKIIKIFEIKNKECPYYFTDLMELKGLKVFNLKSKKTKDQNIKMDPFNSSISIETCKKHNTDNLNNAKLLEEWKSTYKILIPKKKFKKKINKISKKKNLACIHSRITDKHLGFFSFLLEIPNKDVIFSYQINDFYKNVFKLIPKKIRNIYVASDEEFSRKKLIKNLETNFKIIGDKPIFKKNKLRQTSGEQFIIDLFVMSKCNIIISSTGGNVPLTATLISDRKILYLKWTETRDIYKIINFSRSFIYQLRNIFR